MKHLAKLVAACTSGLLVVDFKVQKEGRIRSHVVLDVALIQKCQHEILSLNKISNWCSPELLEE